ncbi:MAG: hypothetical protein R2704_11940 [Microthrixaceae bacterium]
MERTPEVVVAIDHCASGSAGPTDNLAALAEVPSLHLKVSSHNLDGEGDPARFVDTSPRPTAPPACAGARTTPNTSRRPTHSWSSWPGTPPATSTCRAPRRVPGETPAACGGSPPSLEPQLAHAQHPHDHHLNAITCTPIT